MATLLIVGYTNLDVNRYPDGSEQHAIGGAGYFATFGARAVSPSVRLITRLGADIPPGIFEGRIDEATLKRSGSDASKSIQTYVSTTDHTQRSVELFPGASDELSPEDLELDELRGAKIVHVGTMPPTQQQKIVNFLVSFRANEQCSYLIALDSDETFYHSENLPLLEAMFRAVDLSFFNRSEAEIITHLLPELRYAICKKDEDGAVLLERGKEIARADAPKTSAIDVTGAGDVFAGAFLAMRALGKSADESLTTACRLASLSVAARGVSHLPIA